MQWLGDTPREMQWYVNSEVQHMHEDIGIHRPLFRFFRYNVRLEEKFLKDEVGITCSEEEVEKLRLMENVDMMNRCYEIGQRAAERQVRPQDWRWPSVGA
jgi:hypothetical protein